MSLCYYITHPEVIIDPSVPTPDWGLSPEGLKRVQNLAARLPKTAFHVVSSAERKALETAWPLAARLATPVEVRPEMHENDRSSTGFLPEAEFNATADSFFSEPTRSVRGWERASDAQTRIVQEVDAVLAKTDRPVLFTGHGAVGTLLYCALRAIPVDRVWDQARGGNWFAFDSEDRLPHDGWAPIETLFS